MKTPARPPSHVIGDVGQTVVALQFKRWRWTADLITSDYGEDLDCTIFTEGRRTALHFRCQVKSSSDVDESVRKLKSGSFSVSIRSTTCAAWALSYFPVLLVIYDEETGNIHWIDATTQIRARITALSKKTIRLNVPQNSLSSDREAVIHAVSSFYTRLLRLSNPALQCNVYPILMPGYRALPFNQLDRNEFEGEDSRLRLDWTGTPLDSLPAWATTLRVLDGPFLHGWRATFAGDSLETFLAALKQLLSQSQIVVGGDEWVSFVCAPIQFQAQDESRDKHQLWNRELTGWWSYVLLNGVVRADFDHAFQLPNGFLSQVARRARSWDGHWHVDPTSDLAIQFFSAAPTTPAYRVQQSAIRQHALGQFLPWQCQTRDVDSLRTMLAAEELIFREVRGNDINPPAGVVFGAITNLMFDPTIGLIPQARDWSEFTSGSVQTRLHAAEIISHLPGKEGPAEISDFVMSFFGSDFGEVPDAILTSGFDSIPGLPLDHTQRLIVVQRFRPMESTNLKELENAILTAEKKLKEQANSGLSLDVSYRIIPTLIHRVIEVSVSWDPHLLDPATESFEALRTYLVDFFDAVLPRRSLDTGVLRETADILRYDGEIYFEGDDWWPFKRES
jgi:hypothetical protein